MGKLQLRLPDQIHKKVRKIAERESLSINQILVNSISNEIIRYESLRFFEDRSSGFKLDDFLKALEEIPDTEPDKRDRLAE
ncbi:MAG: toxin-antitoxin system HicB family antitoxin [Calditrichia bacterium]